MYKENVIKYSSHSSFHMQWMLVLQKIPCFLCYMIHWEDMMSGWTGLLQCLRCITIINALHQWTMLANTIVITKGIVVTQWLDQAHLHNDTPKPRINWGRVLHSCHDQLHSLNSHTIDTSWVHWGHIRGQSLYKNIHNDKHTMMHSWELHLQ